MPYDLCRHIRTNGRRCQAPSLTGRTWCFFHENLHRRHQGFRHTDATRGYVVAGQHIELSALEDRESVQVAISVVVNALATGQMEPKRATAILYGLQLASSNAATIYTHIAPRDATLNNELTPDGLALAEPGTGEILPYEPESGEIDQDDEDYDD